MDSEALFEMWVEKEAGIGARLKDIGNDVYNVARDLGTSSPSEAYRKVKGMVQPTRAQRMSRYARKKMREAKYYVGDRMDDLSKMVSKKKPSPMERIMNNLPNFRGKTNKPKSFIEPYKNIGLNLMEDMKEGFLGDRDLLVGATKSLMNKFR